MRGQVRPEPIITLSGTSGWPLLLSLEQLGAYLNMSPENARRVCPVPPLELGMRLLRWRRPDIDEWASRLPYRTRAATREMVQEKPPAALAAEERRMTAVERAQRRTSAHQQRAVGNA